MTVVRRPKEIANVEQWVRLVDVSVRQNMIFDRVNVFVVIVGGWGGASNALLPPSNGCQRSAWDARAEKTLKMI